jgi:hypothetical protein
MDRIRTSLAKSAKPKLALALLAMLAVTAVAFAVAKPAPAVTVTPSLQSFTRGEAKTVSFTFNLSNFNGPPTIVVTGLPSAVTWTWTAPSGPAGQINKCTGVCAAYPTGTTSAVLRLSIPYDLASGAYPLRATVTTPNKDSATVTATLSSSAAPQFTVSGNAATSLTLDGPARPIDVSITNPYDHALTVTGLTVSVASVSKPGCAASNFALTQVPVGTTYVIPANSTQAVATKPSVRWPNNTHAAQNACIGATVNFHYAANGTA